MYIDFWGRTFLLISASQYELLVETAAFFSIKELEFLNSSIFEQKNTIESEHLYYGLANSSKDLIKTYPVRLFWEWKDKFYPINRWDGICSNCHEKFVGYIVRSYDLYHGLSNMDLAHQWSLNLPTVSCCPNCGYVEPLQQKFIATVFNGQVFTNL